MEVQLCYESIHCRSAKVAEAVEGISYTVPGKSWYFNSVETRDVEIHPAGIDQADVPHEVTVSTNLDLCSVVMHESERHGRLSNANRSVRAMNVRDLRSNIRE